jgi:hypothetical protein
MSEKIKSELPDLFCFDNGARVQSTEDWRRRRAEVLQHLLDIEYGQFPPSPDAIQAEKLHGHQVRRFGNAMHEQYRISIGQNNAFHFVLDVLCPPGEGPFPVVLNGDECWCYASDEVFTEVLGRGYILARFNRVVFASDNGSSERNSGIYPLYPEQDFGALAAWAWGYHRCVDFLQTYDRADAAKIAVVGHSRGGKAALLAGATDERIALTAPNNSGCGGAGAYRWQGPESETLSDILRAIPYWFGPRLREFVGREDQLPFDQHSLKALVAPRALLTTEALGDLWGNPTGTWQTHAAAREVYCFLGAEQKIGIRYREGRHEHRLADWSTLLDFADWQFKGKSPASGFDQSPFPELPPAFSWAAPHNNA